MDFIDTIPSDQIPKKTAAHTSRSWPPLSDLWTRTNQLLIYDCFIITNKKQFTSNTFIFFKEITYNIIPF